VEPDLRNCDFTTWGFYHGAQRRSMKREAVKHLRVGTTITAHGYMGSKSIKKGKCMLRSGWLRFLNKHPGR
jgi:hypothetical protein